MTRPPRHPKPTPQTEYETDLDEAQLRMRDAQIALIALGYLDINTREIVGEAKGGWGPESRTGLAAFLRDHELPVTEELDARSYRGILAAYDAAQEARAAVERPHGDSEKRQHP